MNRYSLWKYTLIAATLVLGLLYTLPNFYGEAPAVQISAGKATTRIEPALAGQIEQTLKAAALPYKSVSYEAVGQQHSVRVRVGDTETQLKVQDAVNKLLNPVANDPQYAVALNLLSNTPAWLESLRAQPMYLGLDLRGGVHFLLQVDLQAAVVKRLDVLATDVREQLRNKKIRHGGVAKVANGLEVRFRDEESLNRAKTLLRDTLPDLSYDERGGNGEFTLVGSFTPQAKQRTLDFALKQNMTTLHNRINELGVAEPIIQQQGADRIVVQLPGIQDVASALRVLGRTATLEVRMVDSSPEAESALLADQVPLGLERFTERGGRPLLVKKEVILTGENFTDAQAGFDNQSQEPAVHLKLDAKGARIFKEVTAQNVGKRMAILLIEKGRGEIITAPVIRTEIGGGQVQISGQMDVVEANETALLIRAGSLAAPMEVIEQRLIGPSLGKENITKGFNSTLYGFIAIAVFMIGYYMLFGAFSVAALAANVLLLIALLSLLQATLTLPGIAAIALTLGMAIDANVLINERIREELRHGNSPQAAITAGYERAWATILDSNITTLIAGLALLIFGSGAVRGFAVVHCLGILTSMFSSVMVSRALVNLWYGRRKKLASLAIGQVWKPSH
ncbi:protein translocase subunit SecD [Parvibium lacunae]|uniref:Protein translocase subunit SecD n=1 Tax=Parvibium lacunae TaxID=1888893 RepID=A0A368L1M3_9BURK|nr:protein translocase subunit SecD [Parvibium lacunae]RCS57444.1 protein translocase subunit SecD [Parvibium lacunae]